MISNPLPGDSFVEAAQLLWQQFVKALALPNQQQGQKTCVGFRGGAPCHMAGARVLTGIPQP